MKKIFSVLIALISVISIAFAFGGCGGKDEKKFYTVTEAYEEGLLTREQIMSIAYYHHEGIRRNEEVMGEDYIPLPLTPEKLSDKTENCLKQAYLNEYYQDKNYAELSGVKIDRYYGTYNGQVVVMMSDDYSGGADIEWEEKVAGINIYYINGNSIKVWGKIV